MLGKSIADPHNIIIIIIITYSYNVIMLMYYVVRRKV